jgi:hypothetical protein
MAWNDLLANQMVSYTDAQGGGFTLNSGQIAVTSNQCMTKAQAIEMYNVNPNNLSAYANNQLIPKSNMIANITQNYQCGLEGTGVITNTDVNPSVPSITLVTTTNPTNQAGTNGTATITFSGGVGPFTYKLNSVAQGAVTSPFTINGLSSSTSYTVQIIDSNNNTDSEIFTLGQSSFYFDADFIMLTYEFTDGEDLDTKTLLSKITTTSSTISPVPGQNTVANYLGFDQTWNGTTYIGTSVYNFPEGSDTPILTWSGDNTLTGFESVLIDVRQFKIDYPTSTSFVIDCRCLWWVPDNIGVSDVNVAATLWKNNPDEAPVQDGCGGFCWTNPLAVLTGTIDSVSKTITANQANQDDEDRGERLATLTYNLTTKRASFNNNDTTTNVV